MTPRQRLALVVSAAAAAGVLAVGSWRQLNGWIWLVAWQMALVGVVLLTWWIILHRTDTAPLSPRRDTIAILLASGVALGLASFVGWNLYQIHACEKYDRCDKAPAWVGEGLHEMQRLEREKDAGRAP